MLPGDLHSVALAQGFAIRYRRGTYSGLARLLSLWIRLHRELNDVFLQELESGRELGETTNAFVACRCAEGCVCFLERDVDDDRVL